MTVGAATTVSMEGAELGAGGGRRYYSFGGCACERCGFIGSPGGDGSPFPLICLSGGIVDPGLNPNIGSVWPSMASIT